MVRQLGRNRDDESPPIVELLKTEPPEPGTDERPRSALMERAAAAHAPSAPSVTVVIPARNEARNLPHVLPQLPSMITEVILVDGWSVDSTVQLAELLVPNVRVIHQTGRGKGDALRCGIAAGASDIIVLMDADGSNDPREIPLFVAALLAGADYVKGSRYLPSGGSDDLTGLRSFGNRLLTIFANLLLGTHFTDLCYGYNALWRNCADVIPIDCDGFEVEAQMHSRAARAHLRVTEVPSYEWMRKYGTSSLHPLRDGGRIARTILRERFWRAPVGTTKGSVVADNTRSAATRSAPPPQDTAEQANCAEKRFVVTQWRIVDTQQRDDGHVGS